ncbi:hypothetical protein N9195_00545 [bacterium]|nr:hypothetical protein [bacterium]
MTTTRHVLLEGTRKITKARGGQLHQFAAELAKNNEFSIYRSGGALGSDEAFSLGIATTPHSQLELVLPSTSYRKTKIIFPCAKFGLDQVSEGELRALVEAASEATPKYKSGFHSFPNLPPRPKASIALLLRDALKVIGAPSIGLAPASYAYFNLNPETPHSGGTGHTIKICEARRVHYEIVPPA